MIAVARKDDSISGMTTSEHSGHYDEFGNPIHPSSVITGTIHSGCSTKLLSEDRPVALVGSITEEHDECCITSYGVIATGSSKLFVNNVPVAIVGSDITAHNGSAQVISGSSKLFVSS